MSDDQGWLPPLVNVEGEEEAVLQRLREVFVRDFIEGKPLFRGVRVAWNTCPSQGRPEYMDGFIHIVTTDGPPHMRRTIEPPRAERIQWCAALIRNSDCPTMTVWDYEEASGRVRTYLWHKAAQYVVILEKQLRKREAVFYLVTAFCTDGRSTQRALQRKHEKRL